MLIDELQKNKIDSLFVDVSERITSVKQIIHSTKPKDETEKQLKKFFVQKLEPISCDLDVMTQLTFDLLCGEDTERLEDILERYSTPENE